MIKVIAALNKHLLLGTILTVSSLLGLLHLAPLTLEMQLEDICGDCTSSLLLCPVSRYN